MDADEIARQIAREFSAELNQPDLEAATEAALKLQAAKAAPGARTTDAKSSDKTRDLVAVLTLAGIALTKTAELAVIAQFIVSIATMTVGLGHKPDADGAKPDSKDAKADILDQTKIPNALDAEVATRMVDRTIAKASPKE
jgi:hypothetical protein